MKVMTYKEGRTIVQIARDLIEGYIVDVNCGWNASEDWINKVKEKIEREIIRSNKKPSSLIVLNPSPDAPKLVRFMISVKSNKEALMLLKKD